MLEEDIQKWEILEKKYHEIINKKLDVFLKADNRKLRKKEISSHIIACLDGLFIIREGNIHNSNYVFTSRFNGNVEEARITFNLRRLEHVKISNKVQFYSLNCFNYSHSEIYDAADEAKKDFQILTSNDNLVDDHYIRSVADAIELGINANYERGQFIFRGQVNSDWELIPNLFRKYQKEAHLIEIALCESLLLGIKNPYLNTFDPADLLMNLQHFGVPTRLLDWTSDILIALFFACYDESDSYKDKDGNLFIIERAQYTPFKINSSEYDDLKKPINPNTVDLFKKRLEIEDIQVFEPVIKNPRLRIQDGCFMFFTYLPLDKNNNKYVNLHEFMRARNKYIKETNADRNDRTREIWIGNKKIDKNFKEQILTELNELHGISKQTLFVEIEHISSVQKYYLNLYEQAKQKANRIKSQRKEKYGD